MSSIKFDQTFLKGLMFKSLKLEARGNLLFRCKVCKQILFRQDDIDEFMHYDPKPQQFGYLQEFSDHPRCEQEMSYFVLQPEFYYTSLKVDYSKSLVTHYHPFFKMHLCIISCSCCKAMLGYEVETVNENTIWMQGRLLIDVEQCCVLKDTKEYTTRLIRILKQRLANRQEAEKGQQPRKTTNKEQMKRLIMKIQKAENREKKANQLKSEASKIKICEDSKNLNTADLIETNACTNFTSRASTIQQPLSNYQSHWNKPEQTSNRSERSASQNGDTANNISRSRSLNVKTSFQHQQHSEKNKFNNPYLLSLSIEERQCISKRLHFLQNKIIKQSKHTNAKHLVERIFISMNKIDKQQKSIYKRIFGQSTEIVNLIDSVRKNVIQTLEQIV